MCLKNLVKRGVLSKKEADTLIGMFKKIKDKLIKITPETYTGLAEKIVEFFDPKIY